MVSKFEQISRDFEQKAAEARRQSASEKEKDNRRAKGTSFIVLVLAVVMFLAALWFTVFVAIPAVFSFLVGLIPKDDTPSCRYGYDTENHRCQSQQEHEEGMQMLDFLLDQKNQLDR